MANYNRKIIWLLVGIILVAASGLSFGSSLRESQTVDEAVHLSAGYSYLITGDFRLNPEHPPLLKMLAALPLLPLQPSLPLDHPSWSNYNEWEFSYEFLYSNKINYFTLLTVGRLANILIFMLGGWLVFWFTRKIKSTLAAFIALVLYCFCPIFLAHSHYVTTDTSSAVFILATLISCYFYCQRPNWRRLIWLAVIFGLTLLTKFNAVFLVISFILTGFGLLLDKSFRARLAKPVIQLAAFIAIVIAIIWLGYGLTSGSIATDPKMLGLINQGQELTTNGAIQLYPQPFQWLAKISRPQSATGQKILTAIVNQKIPAYIFFRGLSEVWGHNVGGHDAYLAGQYSNQGWWYYFPLAFLIKTPLITLVLLAIALIILTKKVWLGLCRHPRFNFRLNAVVQKFPASTLVYLVIFLPGLIYFLWSMTSHLNLGVRHLAPIYPLLAIFIGYQLEALFLGPKRVWWRRATYCFLTLTILEAAITYPHYLTYFNQLIGGPDYGYRYLLDSNLDWGQELGELKSYLNEQGIKEISFFRFGNSSLEAYGISTKPLPTEEQVNSGEFNGVIVASLTLLYSSGVSNPANEFHWLQGLKPAKVIGYGLNLYDLRKKTDR